MTPRARREDATTTPADPAERAREIALRILTHSPRSAAQLREGLVSRDVDPSIADSLIDRYREVGLLDDAELAATIVRTRYAERGQAPRAIRAELQRKGFEAQHIEAALGQITDQGMEDRARELAAKRWGSLHGVAEPARTRRVVAMLGRKGYSPALAFSVVKDLQRADKAGVD